MDGRRDTAIGYSGMGYATTHVKMLKIARGKGQKAFAPTVENTQNDSYPIARPLFMYTAGDPNDTIRNYLDWIYSTTGQKIVAVSGYVPVAASQGIQ